MVKKKKKVEEETEEEGMSLDDAFGDDEDVSYAESKPRKEKKKKKVEEDLDEELDEIEESSKSVDIDRSKIKIKQSKPISKVKKGDKIKIDGKEYEVDAHYVLMEHGSTNEMALEVFDSKNDKDYQLRYFDDQVEGTLELYELQEILYVKRAFSKLEW